MEFSGVPLAATWSAMSACVDKGLAKHIGVCNMTTGLLRDLSASATAAGVNACIPKPVQLQELQNALNTHVKSASQEDETALN
jgi:aryl-alcohol dehydrogenase-like predicted oxidoreductase